MIYNRSKDIMVKRCCYMLKSIKKDKLTVNIYENRDIMGAAAAADIEKCIKRTAIEYSPKFKSYYNFDNFYSL